MKRITIDLLNKDGFWSETEVPAKWVVCERCQGNGTHTNSLIDGNGLTDDCLDDPDFMAHYMSGGFDVRCEDCKGERVLLVMDEESLAAEYVADYQRAQDASYQSRMEA